MGSKTKPRPRSLLTISRVRGTLWLNGEAHPATWKVRVDLYGRIEIAFDPLPMTTKGVFKSERTRFVPLARVDGIARDGRRVFCDHVVILSRQISIGGRRDNHLTLAGEAQHLTIEWLPIPRTRQGLRVQYHMVGMLGFRVNTLQLPVGEVAVGGPSEIDDYDRIAGQIQVKSTSKAKNVASWLKQCDDAMERITAVISLAEGRRVPWSIRHVVRDRDDRIIRTELFGPRSTGRPRDPLGHSLNLDPFLELVSRMTNRLRKTTGFDVALYWFLLNPLSVELQLLAAITAIEHLVATYATQRRRAGLSIDARRFATLRKQIDPIFEKELRQLRRKSSPLLTKTEYVFGIVRAANRASLNDKLFAMLQSYRVPIAGLEEPLRRAITARNRIVHQGAYKDPGGARALYRHVVVLRETLKRVFLTLFEYRGTYQSTLNRLEWTEFPPRESAVVELQDE